MAGQKYKGCNELKIEADYSQAAFFLVADAIGCNVECLNLNPIVCRETEKF